MDIVETKEGSKLILKLTDKLDTNSAPELNEYLKVNLEGVTELEFDLSDLIYISSAGLRVLLATQKAMSKQGSMRIYNVKDIVMEVFLATAFTKIMDITAEGD